MAPSRPAPPVAAALSACSLTLATSASPPAPPRGVDPTRHIFIACDDHTDYLWTADVDTYRQAFLTMIDFYLDLADATEANPPQFQSRFACDGSLWLWEYERNRTPEQWDRLIARVRSGHISAPMTPLVILWGGAPAEAVIRGMSYAGRLERRYGLDFDLAVSMENQVLPWGLASLWAGSGAKYSWKGICGCVSRTPDAGNREHDIYWYTGPDGQRILMKWNSSLWGNQSIGGYAEARDIPASVNIATTDPNFLARYPYPIVGIFGRGWDDLQTLTTDFVTQAQALTGPLPGGGFRQVHVSNEHDFFTAFEAAHAGQIPSEARAYGNEWELYCASLAEVSASVKRSVEKLRAAEAMAGVVSLYDPSFMVTGGPAGTPAGGGDAPRDQAFMNLGLYWEHNWTADGPVPRSVRAQWQRDLAAQIAGYVNALHADAAAGLSRLIPAEPGATRFYVFNPLGWTRTAAADLDFAPGGDVHVVDVATQQQIPAQVVTVGGTPRLRVLASDLPSVGYRVVEVRPGPGPTPFNAAATVTPGKGGSEPQPLTATYAISANNRDALSQNVGQPVHRVQIDGYSPGEPTLFVGSDTEQQTAAMQFAIDLPPGTTITGAHLAVRASASQSPSPTGAMAIRAYDLDDTPPFVTGPFGDLVNLHPTLPLVISWPQSAWPGGGVDAQSPDIAPLVQAFLNRPGYAPGNHLGLVVTEGSIQPNRYVGWDDAVAPGDGSARLTVEYPDPDPDPPPSADSLIVDNGLMSVELTGRGAIVSLVDHTRGDREFVRVIGGKAMNDLGPGAGVVSVESVGPVSVTLKAVTTAPLAREVRVTLHRGSSRVDIENRITQNFADVRTYAFGFDLDDPLVRHEEVGAIATARLTTDPAAPGSYSPRNARYDWLTLNHFADITSRVDGVGVTLSNADAFFFQLGASSIGALDAATPQISPLIGGQVDGSGLGIPQQGGDALFTHRFALVTHDAFSAPAAMRHALEHQNPPVTGPVVGPGPTSGARPAPDLLSAVTIPDPNVLLWAFKPANDGVPTGVVTRAWNLGAAAPAVPISITPRAVAAATAATHLETPQVSVPTSAGAAVLPLASQQIATLILEPCRVDFDANGVVNSTDVSEFINQWFADQLAGTTYTDIDANGVVNSTDVSDFINAWFDGCTPV
jgi:hypothetical protein